LIGVGSDLLAARVKSEKDKMMKDENTATLTITTTLPV
jgi:hypothetical protein